MDKMKGSKLLPEIYEKLFACYGPQNWWPADEPFEVIIGAILTQSAAWSNVEKAIINLKTANALSAETLRRIPESELAQLIYPCGYYNAKAVKLKAIARWFGERFNDDLDSLFKADIESLRQQLLSVHGIGHETADSIILYAAGKPVFVIDAYTRRIIDRIGLSSGKDNYDSYQALFMRNLLLDVQLFNEYHALLVCLGKNVCRKKPLCDTCCLKGMCKFQQDL